MPDTAEKTEQGASFDTLASWLELAGYECLPVQADAASPYPQLLVLLDPGAFAEPLGVRLRWLEDAATLGMQSLGIEFDELEQSFATLEFWVRWPMPIMPDKLAAVQQIAQICSQRLPFGVFGCTAADGAYFRYCHLQGEKQASADEVGLILGLTTPALQRFEGLLQRLLAGDALEQILTEAKK